MADSDVCTDDSCAVKPPAGAIANGAKETAGDGKAPILVYSRAVCGLCWICRWHFWTAGLEYEVKDVDNDTEWYAALDNNGYQGGTFKLPVVVHGSKAWWDIKDHAALAKELKERTSPATR